MKIRTIEIILLLLILLLLGSCGHSLYKPGDLTAKRNGRQTLSPPKDYNGKEHYWKLDEDIEIYHFKKGQGTPVLVVHGGPAFPVPEAWKALDPLTGTYEFRYYHQRGCGKSTIPYQQFENKNYMKNMMELHQKIGIPAHLADMEKIRQILNQDKLIIVAHSYGAFLACLYAYEFPGHLKALVLISPPNVIKLPNKQGNFYHRIKKHLPKDQHNEFDEWLHDFFDYKNIFKRTEDELAAINNKFNKYVLSASGNEQDKVLLNNKTCGFSGFGVHACFLSMGGHHDYSQLLKNIDCPTLVLHGEHDLMPPESSREYHRLIHNSEYHIIKNTGHFMIFNDPEEFSNKLTSFLQKIE